MANKNQIELNELSTENCKIEAYTSFIANPLPMPLNTLRNII